jgi:hypothetical protein
VCVGGLLASCLQLVHGMQHLVLHMHVSALSQEPPNDLHMAVCSSFMKRCRLSPKDLQCSTRVTDTPQSNFKTLPLATPAESMQTGRHFCQKDKQASSCHGKPIFECVHRVSLFNFQSPFCTSAFETLVKYQTNQTVFSDLPVRSGLETGKTVLPVVAQYS